MSRKCDVRKNQLKLHHFYIEVIETVCNQLEAQHKRKSATREWNFDINVLLDLREGAKHYLQDQTKWFSRCIEHREGRHQTTKILPLLHYEKPDLQVLEFNTTPHQYQQE